MPKKRKPLEMDEISTFSEDLDTLDRNLRHPRADDDDRDGSDSGGNRTITGSSHQHQVLMLLDLHITLF